MRVAVSGASGLIGSALVRSLRADGYEVVRLVRRAAAAPDEAGYDPEREFHDPERLEGCRAVVHLAGADPGARAWSAADLRAYRHSRYEGTRKLCQNVSLLRELPEVIVSASSLAFLGSAGERALGEEGPRGAGAWAEFTEDWESGAEMIEAVGMRLVLARFGAVLAPRGGLLEALRRVVAEGRDPAVGQGASWFSWVHVDDAVAALRFLVADATIERAVHVAAPGAVRQADVARALGASGARLTPEEVAARFGAEHAELWLADRRAEPRALAARGFRFARPQLADALAACER